MSCTTMHCARVWRSVAAAAGFALIAACGGSDDESEADRADDPQPVATAQMQSVLDDPLRSEGRLYAERLRAAGVSAEWINYAGVTHEFFGMGALVDEARNAVARAADALKAAYVRVGP